jgi:hypothetical protein
MPAQTWAWHPLYPSGPNAIYATRHNVFTFNYSYSATCQSALQERIDQAATAGEREQWQAMAQALDAYPLGTNISGRYALGGNGYTHSIPNTGRVLAEGLDGYARRVAAGKAQACNRSTGVPPVSSMAILAMSPTGILPVVLNCTGATPVSTIGVSPMSSLLNSEKTKETAHGQDAHATWKTNFTQERKHEIRREGHSRGR